MAVRAIQQLNGDGDGLQYLGFFSMKLLPAQQSLNISLLLIS